MNSVDTGTSSNSGCVAICATMICIASQCGNHIEQDIQFALDASADYIILDGRGGGTGAAPTKCLGTPIAAIGP
ncbi:glutamate synthase-related protein [Vibrio parahaemolyticus]|uniref:glutamate synthase-related protein n=1 Tax=Vibrio parahaemolyticus TaxID=670 RepID=UPI0035A2768A